MAAKLIIGFLRGGRISQVTDFVHSKSLGGVVLDGESSAFPRGIAFSIEGADAATKFRMDNVRRQNGWASWEFKVHFSRAGRRLQVEGVDANSLPAGRYNFGLEIGGILFKEPRKSTVEIKGTGRTELVFEEDAPKLVFRLDDPFVPVEPETIRILKASTIDGKRGDRWIRKAVRNRDRRKASLMNILAKLATTPLKTEGTSLSQWVRKVEFVEMDRIYANVDPEFFQNVKRAFGKKDLTVHPTHERLLVYTPEPPKKYRLHSYREDKATLSLQVIGAVPKGGGDVTWVDIDIDKANPGKNFKQAIIHLGHLFDSGKTNHLAMNKKLRAELRDFLYYSAESA